MQGVQIPNFLFELAILLYRQKERNQPKNSASPLWTDSVDPEEIKIKNLIFIFAAVAFGDQAGDSIGPRRKLATDRASALARENKIKIKLILIKILKI